MEVATHHTLASALIRAVPLSPIYLSKRFLPLFFLSQVLWLWIHEGEVVEHKDRLILSGVESV